MKNTALKYAILKINIIVFMILAFGLYNHFIITSIMLAIAGLDIILAISELQIAGRKKAKFILLLLLHAIIISVSIIIGIEKGLFAVIAFLALGIVTGEISVVEYQKITEE